MLITLQEVQAMAALFNKCPMTPAEVLWANMLTGRLFAYAQPKPPEPPKPPDEQPPKPPGSGTPE